MSSKMASKKTIFVKKLKILCNLDLIRSVQMSLACGTFKHFQRNVWRDFRLPMSALAMVERKSFSGKFNAKINFPIRHFMLPLLMLTLEA